MSKKLFETKQDRTFSFTLKQSNKPLTYIEENKRKYSSTKSLDIYIYMYVFRTKVTKLETEQA